MSSAEKDAIKACLTPAQCSGLTPAQKATLNVDNTLVPIEGDKDAPYAEQTFETFTNSKTGQSAIALKSRPEDRWYAIYKAYGFTGVVCGWDLYRKYVAQGGSHASSEKADSCEDAEYKWLLVLHKNDGCVENMRVT
jgi:hypothetical protein